MPKKISNGLQIAKDYAKSKGGECLSNEYINARTKLEWKCSNPEHKSWFATLRIFYDNNWCYHCYNESKTQPFKKINGLQIAKEHAKSKGGECLSTKYTTSNHKLEWKCHNPEHKSWLATFSKVVTANRWCPRCSGKFDKNEMLQIAKDYAILRGGFCLSQEYFNNEKLLKWECANHHIWESSFRNVVPKKHWCPECGRYNNIQETRVRSFLNYLLNANFVKIKLPWNFNPINKNLLELDGYSDELKIAFEFQGEHHFRLAYGRDEDSLQYIKELDKQKIINCEKNNVKLLIIPILPEKDRSDFNVFKNQILDILSFNKLLPIDNYDENYLYEIFHNVKVNNFQVSFLKKAHEYAKSKNGNCLSDVYLTARTKMKWVCKNNHIWEGSYDSVVNGNTWCKICNSLKRKEQKK